MKAHNGTRLALAIVALCFVTDIGLAQQGYKKPPKEVLDILNAPVTPGISVSPTRDNVILTTGLRYPPLADLAQPILRLAGRRINPAANSPHRYQYSVALTLKRVADGSSPARRKKRRRLLVHHTCSSCWKVTRYLITRRCPWWAVRRQSITRTSNRS